MVEIDVKLDDRVLKEMKQAQKKYGEKVVQRAERDAAKKARTAMKREIRKKYNVTSEEMDKHLVAKNGEIRAESKKFSIGTDTHFSHTPAEYESQKNIPVKKRKKAAVKVFKKGRKKFKHAFILNPQKVKNGNEEDGNGKTMLWRREKGELHTIRSASVAEMANQKEISEKAQKVMSETFENRLHHYIDREVSKIANH